MSPTGIAPNGVTMVLLHLLLGMVGACCCLDPLSSVRPLLVPPDVASVLAVWACQLRAKPSQIARNYPKRPLWQPKMHSVYP